MCDFDDCDDMTIFTYKNIPVRIHASFWILVALVILPELLGGRLNDALYFVALGVGLFGSVILHEFGHALVGRKFGIDTNSITLYPFGGIARLTSGTWSSKAEFCIAIAGPAVNFILCAILIPFSVIGVPFVNELIWVNLVLGVFNLVPAFPMDGGRVLRALLSMKMSRSRATRICLWVSGVYASLFAVLGLASGHVGLVLIAGMLFFFIWSEKIRSARTGELS